MNVCEWWSLRSALAHFVTFRGSTQSQRHIKPLHWYVACRLVVEGGFDPDEIVPRRHSASPGRPRGLCSLTIPESAAAVNGRSTAD